MIIKLEMDRELTMNDIIAIKESLYLFISKSTDTSIKVTQNIYGIPLLKELLEDETIKSYIKL